MGSAAINLMRLAIHIRPEVVDQYHVLGFFVWYEGPARNPGPFCSLSPGRLYMYPLFFFPRGTRLRCFFRLLMRKRRVASFRLRRAPSCPEKVTPTLFGDDPRPPLNFRNPSTFYHLVGTISLLSITFLL